jgi:hypothetical protein
MKWMKRCCAALASVSFVCLLTTISLYARSNGQSLAFGACKPVSERTTEVGCWILVDQPVGRIEQAQIFWHLDVYPTLAEAEKAKGPRGTVVESLGKVWLLTIEKAGWRPAPGGKLVGSAGGAPVIVPGGPPMLLTATGTEQRRALTLILHESSKAPTTVIHDWTPRGLCHVP